MKSFFSALILLLVTIAPVYAQTPYTSVKDDRQVTILNGTISKYILENDTTFTWYEASQKTYSPDSSIINALEAAKGKITFLLFGGTWCEDTQFILPKFFKLQEKAGFPDNSIGFFGVDRQKKTLGNLAAVFGITNVPTIIVLKEGKEIGRIVEYGKTGKWDKELTDLLK